MSYLLKLCSKYNKDQTLQQITAHCLMLCSMWPVLNVQYLLLGFSHVMYGSCCNVLTYTTVAIFRLNEVEELYSPINQVKVGGVDHDAIKQEGATARNNNL